MKKSRRTPIKVEDLFEEVKEKIPDERERLKKERIIRRQLRNGLLPFRERQDDIMGRNYSRIVWLGGKIAG